MLRRKSLLDHKSIKQFMDIYYAETGIQLNYGEALNKAENLLQLIKELIQDLNRREKRDG